MLHSLRPPPPPATQQNLPISPFQPKFYSLILSSVYVYVLTKPTLNSIHQLKFGGVLMYNLFISIQSNIVLAQQK